MRGVALLVAGALLAGCGGGDDAPRESRDADRPAVPGAQGFQEFQKCLRDNGIEVPDANPHEGPAIVEPPPEEVRKKCEKHLPEGGPGLGPAPHQAPLPQSPGP